MSFGGKDTGMHTQPPGMRLENDEEDMEDELYGDGGVWMGSKYDQQQFQFSNKNEPDLLRQDQQIQPDYLQRDAGARTPRYKPPEAQKAEDDDIYDVRIN